MTRRNWKQYLAEWVTNRELAKRIREAMDAGLSVERIASHAGTTPEVINKLADAGRLP